MTDRITLTADESRKEVGIILGDAASGEIYSDALERLVYILAAAEFRPVIFGSDESFPGIDEFPYLDFAAYFSLLCAGDAKAAWEAAAASKRKAERQDSLIDRWGRMEGHKRKRADEKWMAENPELLAHHAKIAAENEQYQAEHKKRDPISGGGR